MGLVYGDTVFNQEGPPHIIGPFAKYVLVLRQQATQLFLLAKVDAISLSLHVQVDQMGWQAGLVLF